MVFMQAKVIGHGNFVLANCLSARLVACGASFSGGQSTSPLTIAQSDAEALKRLCEEGQLSDAVEALDLLGRQGSYADKALFYCLLKRCIAQKDLHLGKRIHALTVQGGYASDAFRANHIIRMYASHGRLEEANQVFSEVVARDCHVWTAIISAYAEQGHPAHAIFLYRQMRQSVVKPNSYVFVATLKACALAEDLAAGKEVHLDFLRSGVDRDDVYVGNSLVDMYAKCGSLNAARNVFDNLGTRDVVTWNAMIGGYVQIGQGQEALALYGQMQQEGFISANHVTYVCLLQACANLKALHVGRQLHARVQQSGLDSGVVVGSTIVDMYAKCGRLEEARKVFDGLTSKNVITWTAMISGYTMSGFSQDALALYATMQQEGLIATDYVLFVSLLQACAGVGALQQGKQLHEQVKHRGLDAREIIGSTLVAMYAKCGSMKDARKVFDSLSRKNVITWTALLNGYAGHGEGQNAIQCFREMLQQGVNPDAFTFSCLLVACSQEGLVPEGRKYFRAMVEEHGVSPSAYHYSCMVDLLGRSGHLEEAEEILRNMASESEVGWTSLLSCCKIYGDIERGKRCFDSLVALDPKNSAAYVLFSSIYANAGQWADVDRVERLGRSAGAWRKPGKAYIEVNRRVHEFTVGEGGAEGAGSRSMNMRLKEGGGHVPQTELVLKAVSVKEKEDLLCGHAEKLALAYGLMNTPDGTALLVTKNLRMCDDCHSSTKIMSRLDKREIVVRDAHRVHHFLDGTCSCGDRH